MPRASKSLVISYIYHRSPGKSSFKSIARCTTAAEAWKVIEEMMHVRVTDAAAICELTHGLLCQLPKKGVCLSVVEYLGKMKALGDDEMVVGGRPLEDEELSVQYVITGLNDQLLPPYALGWGIFLNNIF
jgi:hypothetical protein